MEEGHEGGAFAACGEVTSPKIHDYRHGVARVGAKALGKTAGVAQLPREAFMREVADGLAMAADNVHVRGEEAALNHGGGVFLGEGFFELEEFGEGDVGCGDVLQFGEEAARVWAVVMLDVLDEIFPIRSEGDDVHAVKAGAAHEAEGGDGLKVHVR